MHIRTIVTATAALTATTLLLAGCSALHAHGASGAETSAAPAPTGAPSASAAPTGTATTDPGATATPATTAPGTPLAAYDTSQIELVGQSTETVDGRSWTSSHYVNHAYACGRSGDFPFLVVEPSDTIGQAAPLWVLLHGGGIGWYLPDGTYEGGEAHNDAESATALAGMLSRYVGDDGRSDTFVGDRFRAGDRFVLGSLCDHDLMLGVGEAYPNDPHGIDPTVDGLLANLAMVDAVEHGTGTVARRPTDGTWILGTSAGSYGAYGLAANLWLRGTPADGAVLDSGILSSPKIAMADAGIIRQGEIDPAALDALDAKLGPYFADDALWLENTIPAGFDTPFLLVSEEHDPACNGTATAPPIPGAVAAGYDSNCAWVQGVVQQAVDASGDPATQWTRLYPGTTHTASDVPGTPMQDDLRAWYAAAGGS